MIIASSENEPYTSFNSLLPRVIQPCSFPLAASSPRSTSDLLLRAAHLPAMWTEEFCPWSILQILIEPNFFSRVILSNLLPFYAPILSLFYELFISQSESLKLPTPYSFCYSLWMWYSMIDFTSILSQCRNGLSTRVSLRDTKNIAHQMEISSSFIWWQNWQTPR